MNPAATTPAAAAAAPAEAGWAGLRRELADNSLKYGVGLWATMMVGTGTYLYRTKRHLPISQKIIFSRMVAQAGVLSAVCVGGLFSYLNSTQEEFAPTPEQRLARIQKAAMDNFSERPEDNQVFQREEAPKSA